jgi:PAS domain S-box-containing protein
LHELVAIIDSSHDAIIGNRLDGTVTSWNPAAERIYGYSAAEMIGSSIEVLEPEDRRGEIRGFFERIAKGEKIAEVETVRLRKDGTRVDVLVAISPTAEGDTIVGASMIAHDLTLRHAAEEALSRSEESYRHLFERHPVPMFVYEPGSLRFLAVNEAMVESYGWSSVELLGTSISTIWPPEDEPALRRVIEEARAGDVHMHEARHRTKSGNVIPVAITARSIDFDGRRARVVLAQDLTAQRQLEDELRQTQKMDAIGRLTGGIAHDFNNLLVVIRGNCHLLLKRLQGEERDFVEQIDTAAARASEFTGQLLAFSRQQVLRPVLVDLNEAVVDTLSILRRSLPETIEVETALDPGIGAVLIDRSELVKAILNLAINARDAMPDGGRLEIRTADVNVGEKRAGGTLPPGRYVLLQTTDSGIGMDAETQERAFDPFYTTKSEGTGLGLATIYGLVKQSGGHIWLYSELGYGTTFKLYLPVSGSAPVPPPAPESAGTLEGTESILLVEDTELVRDLVTATLRSYGYEIIAVNGAEEALAVAKDPELRIDLVLTDVVMPGMNGRELAEELVAARPGVKVLFTSGYPADTVLRLGIADASAAFIEKPYLPDELARAIRTVIDQESEKP